MAKRGRKSAASLGIPRDLTEIRAKPPRPPLSLREAEAKVWTDVVSKMPAHWFSEESFPLLLQYCRHIVQSEIISGMVQEAADAEPVNLRTYDKLLAMQTRESRSIMQLATKMRLSQTGTIDIRAKKDESTAQAPWQA